MMASLQTTSQELAHVTEQLKLKEEELQTLRNGKHLISLLSGAIFLCLPCYVNLEVVVLTSYRVVSDAPFHCVCVAELQRAQSSLSQLQEEGERLRAWAQEREEEKDSQLVSLRQELLTQNKHLDSCQSRVRTHSGHSH